MIKLLRFKDDYLNEYINSRVKDMFKSFIEDDICATDLYDEIASSGVGYDEWIKEQGTLSILVKEELYCRNAIGVPMLVPSSVPTDTAKITEWLREPLKELECVFDSDIPEELSIEAQYVLRNIYDYMLDNNEQWDIEDIKKYWDNNKEMPYDSVFRRDPTDAMLLTCLKYAMFDYEIMSSDEELMEYIHNEFDDKSNYIFNRAQYYVGLFTDLRRYLYDEEDPLIELEGDFYYE